MDRKNTSPSNGNGNRRSRARGDSEIAAALDNLQTPDAVVAAAIIPDGGNGNGHGANGGNGNGNGNGHSDVLTEAVRDMVVGVEVRPLPPKPAATPQKHYDCLKCPAYCCSYEKITVGKRDIARLAKHFDIDFETAKQRFTKTVEDEPVLRHQKDEIYGSVCMFLSKEDRRCTIYHARPGVCHEYPDRPRCGYYEFLRWERRHQDDKDFVPLRKG